MELQNIGEVFYSGRVINLDNASIEFLNDSLEKMKYEKEDLLNQLNNIVNEIQN